MWGDVYKVKEGKILAGVCAGLEASGKGNRWLYRVLFLPPAFFTFGYIFLALTMKSAETINEVKEKLVEKDKKLLGRIVEKKKITKSKSRMKAIKCPNCGAPFLVQGLAFQKCAYCELELHSEH